ncbi:hypothetical protein SAY86_023353 [Trapa natans]|uniref:Uncharacterized protein n=1 Tax=Trapa natans TaxID=22666 RepID=A0AAN7RBG2_TRANT|nr:hypothetical protein SAY86_023353 [Trapa natans]
MANDLDSSPMARSPPERITEQTVCEAFKFVIIVSPVQKLVPVSSVYLSPGRSKLISCSESEKTQREVAGGVSSLSQPLAVPLPDKIDPVRPKIPLT